MKEKREFKGPDLMNFCKYLLSFSVVVISFVNGLMPNNPKLISLWIILAGSSSIFSYLWDIKFDWGFFQKEAQHKFLREKLSYSQPHVYYLAMFFNLVLRLTWVCTISPDIIKSHVRVEFFMFLIAFLEILRRAIWNFFRVEKEHITNCGVFRALGTLSLPFQELTVLAGDKFKRDEENKQSKQELSPFDGVTLLKGGGDSGGKIKQGSSNLKTIDEENSSDVARRNNNKILAAYDKNYEGGKKK